MAQLTVFLVKSVRPSGAHLHFQHLEAEAGELKSEISSKTLSSKKGWGAKVTFPPISGPGNLDYR